MDHRGMACWLYMLLGDRYRWTTEGWLAGCTCYLATGTDGPQRDGLLAVHVTWQQVQMDHRGLACWLYMLLGNRYRWTTEGLLAGCTCYLAKGIDGPQTAGLLAAHVTWRKV